MPHRNLPLSRAPRCLLTLCLAFAITAIAGCGDSHHPEPSAAVTQPSRPTAELKGIKLGDTVTEVKRLYQNAKCTEKDGGVTSCDLGFQTFAGLTGQFQNKYVYAFLQNDKVEMVMVGLIDNDDLPQVASALSAKFGAPDDVARRPNGLANMYATWSDKDWILMIDPPHGKNSGQVLLAKRAYLDKARNAAVEKAVHDI